MNKMPSTISIKRKRSGVVIPEAILTLSPPGSPQIVHPLLWKLAHFWFSLGDVTLDSGVRVSLVLMFMLVVDLRI